jgi:DNA-binding NarL/FixJ family response regulator
VEQKIGLNTGHLKSILANARKQIVSHWYEKSGTSNNMSTEDIRHLIVETQTEGVVVYRFHNGRVDKPTSIRTQLRKLVDANGIEILKLLNKKRAEVVRLFIEGYTSEEVAHMLDGKPKTVRNHVGHALKSLKNMVQLAE